MGYIGKFNKITKEIKKGNYLFINDYTDYDLQNLPIDVVSLEFQSFYEPDKKINFPPLLKQLQMPFNYNFPLDNLPDSIQ